MDNALIERLITLRKILDVRQGVFAEKIGLPQSTYSTIERGINPLHDRHIKLICLTFNVNETWLRTGNGDMFTGEAPEEQELLELFRNISPETRKLVLDYVRLLLHNQQALQPPAP